MLTQSRLDETAPAAKIPAFIKAHGGDGPGFFTIGFGCDGRSFNMDAWRVGSPGAVTTYDLEGLTTTTSISGPQGAIEVGQEVTLHGAVVDNTGAPVPSARLVLEAQGPNGGWQLVDGADGADPALTVAPEATTTYRWRFVDRPLAGGSNSAPFTVEVLQAPEQARPRSGSKQEPAKPAGEAGAGEAGAGEAGAADRREAGQGAPEPLAATYGVAMPPPLVVMGVSGSGKSPSAPRWPSGCVCRSPTPTTSTRPRTSPR